MDFVPDSDFAKLFWSSDDFHTYTRAYINTNENLHISMKYMPKRCGRALVVAASGDHPLFCSLYGAEHVDTFDVSYNAKCLMDIKVAALGCLDREQYSDLLEDLYSKNNICDVRYIQEISKRIPQQQYKYLCEMKYYPVFQRGITADIFGYDDFDGRALTVSEYEKLREILKEPYNFILANIDDLSAHLTGKYDFMHLSNIFDYVPKQNRFDVLEPLLNHVNVGGRILIQHMGKRRRNVWNVSPIPIKTIFSDVFWDWRFKRCKNRISVLQKVR